MNNFFKNVITLMTGTLMGQLLIILTLPVITRLYSPEQFGEYSNMVAIISILGVITTLRYDIAMAITDKREERNNLLYLSLILNLVISIFILIVLSLLSIFFKAFSIVEITYIFISTLVLG
ncbi:oligosaccharide flippase family protein, partial [Staphylococcus saprophyticus]|uniref:oligosaccharide flippase family protein n=2 Tax=Staphylococcus TaxID=1279 RepID=UPI000D4CEDDD